MSLRSTLFALAAVTTLGLSGCDAIDEMMDPANALAKRKMKKQNMISALYDEYGGIAGSEEAPANAPAKADPAAPPAAEEGGVMGFANALADSVMTAVKETDRAGFEAYCEQLGNGERVVPVTPKAREFFAQPSTASTCRSINALTREIAELEAKIASKGG